MYIITARVIHGTGIARGLGFPTANLRVPKHTAPLDGIYSAWAYIHGQWFRAAVSVGKSPMFPQHTWKVEAHLLDTRRRLYGKIMTIVFVRRIRPMRKFESIVLLKKIVAHDIAFIRRALIAKTVKK